MLTTENKIALRNFFALAFVVARDVNKAPRKAPRVVRPSTNNVFQILKNK